VQVIADPIGRLVWISPVLPGARHDMGAAREHGIVDALTAAEVDAVADTAYQGGGPTIRTPQRRRRLHPDTGRYRRRSRNQKEANAAHARPTRAGRAGQRRAEELADLVAASGSATATTSSTPTSTTSATTSATPPTATPTTTGGVAVGAGVGVGSGADEALARPATRAAVPTTSRRATTQAAVPKPAAPKTTPKKTTEKPAAAYYKNCAAVRAAGKAPTGRGQLGYASHLDSNNDGVGCE